MLRIDFPKPQFAMQKKDDKEYIFDSIRKKWVRLTPEEWVRQNMLQFLIAVKQYPLSLIAIEKEIRIGERKKRCDIVVYKSSKPWMIIECKQPEVSLSESTIMQAVHYNLVTCCTYLLITNGTNTQGWYLGDGTAEEIITLPEW